MAAYSEHSFWCINCGNRALPLLRPNSRKKEKFHRKKLYCYHCKQEVNCIECESDEEIYEFKQLFENGEFIQEAKECLEYLATERCGNI